MNLKFWKWDLWRYRSVIRNWKSLRDLAVDQREAQFKELMAERLEREQAIKELNAVRRQRDEMRKQEVVMLGIVADLKAQLSTLRVLRKLDSMPLAKPELLAALRTADENTSWWRALHATIADVDEQFANELCEPDIGAELAQYRRGRMAGLRDWQAALMSWHEESRKQEEAGA